MGYTTRQATSKDIAKLTELRVQQLTEKTPELDVPTLAVATMRHLVENLDKKVFAWVAERDGEIVAAAFVDINNGIPRPSNPHGRYGEVLGAYVEPEHRGQTLGLRLITDVVMDMRTSDHGLGYLKVDVDDVEEPFFRKIGFTRHGRELRLRYNK